jgi:ribosomal protein L7/L12
MSSLFGLLFGSSDTRPRVRLGALDRKLDLLLKHLGIEPPAGFSERVRQLAADPARKIEAIKALREETGMGLAEAKEAVESGRCGPGLEEKVDLLLRHFGVEVPADTQWQLLARDPSQKIAAIKAYREETGAGLAEAKDAVEEWVRRNA